MTTLESTASTASGCICAGNRCTVGMPVSSGNRKHWMFSHEPTATLYWHVYGCTLLTLPVFLARELANSFLHKGKELPVVLQAHSYAFRRGPTMVEGACQELEHIQGAGKVPSPICRLGARVSAGN